MKLIGYKCHECDRLITVSQGDILIQSQKKRTLAVAGVNKTIYCPNCNSAHSFSIGEHLRPANVVFEKGQSEVRLISGGEENLSIEY